MRKLWLFLAVLCLGAAFHSWASWAQIAGDANGDSIVNVGDVVYEVSYLYRAGPPPVFYGCGDPTADCTIDLADLVYLVNYLFKQGPDPQILDCGWSEPVNLGLPINSPRGEESFRMTPDGRMAVWVSSREGTHGNGDIWYSFWDSVSGTWSEPENCGLNVNSVIEDLFPSLSADGKKLYCLLFGRPGGFGNWDVWVSTWDSLNNQWGVIENLGPSINTYDVWSPFISPDGSRLYYSGNGIGVFEWNGTDWDGPFTLSPNVNQGLFESDPTVTEDNQTLYFTRWSGTYYVCVSHWTGTKWGPAVKLGPQINDLGGAGWAYVSADGSKLYFVSARPGGLGSGDIWVSERISLPQRKRR